MHTISDGRLARISKNKEIGQVPKYHVRAELSRRSEDEFALLIDVVLPARCLVTEHVLVVASFYRLVEQTLDLTSMLAEILNRNS